MPTLRATVKKQLNGATRIAFLGVGSDLRGDDVAGILAVQLLEERLRKIKPRLRWKVFIGASAPENFTGAIKKFKPTHIVLIDSATLGKKTGTAEIVDINKTSKISFCTHNLPVNIFVDYLTHSLGCAVVIIGIQPKRLDFNSQPSQEIIRAARRVSTMIASILTALS